LVLAVLVAAQTQEEAQREAHQHSRQSILLVAVKEALIQPIMPQLVAQVAAVELPSVQQLARLVTLEVTLLLRVMQEVGMVVLLLVHTLLVVVVDRAQ
jgi:hypothetical protein